MRRYVLVLILFVVLIATINWAVVGDIKSGRLTVPHVIDQTGDTAEVNKYHQFVARDSFVYIDTIGPGSGSKTAVTHTSANLVRRITPGLDTSITYACSVDCGTNIYGFEWDAGGLTQNALANLIDTLVDSINNVAGMKDTVTAEDSSTYIKLVSRFGQQRLEGAARWILVLGDSLTEGDSTSTLTVAMVCDSMVATINATAAISDSVTAANDGDTVYTVTADRPGWDIYCTAGDTAQDVTNLTANKASWSYFYDTFVLFPMATAGYNTLEGTAVLRASGYTAVGYGLLDSGWVQLWGRVGPYDGTPTGGTWTLIASDTSEGLPTTLTVAVEDSATIYGELLYLIARVADTATDTAATANHVLDYWFMRVED